MSRPTLRPTRPNGPNRTGVAAARRVTELGLDEEIPVRAQPVDPRPAQGRGDTLAAVGDDVARDLDRRGHDLAQPGFGSGAAAVLVFAAAGAV